MTFVILWDLYSSLFALTVSLIALAVFTFSKSYIEADPHYGRFHLLLIRFVASMFMLILRPGLVSLLLGWDGLGLSSFLLVMYYRRGKSLNASLLTVITNRLGDGLILRALALGLSGSRFNLSSWSLGSGYLPYVALLVVGAFTKRAQVPFCA